MPNLLSKSRSKMKSERGFTVIEVIVAITLVGLVSTAAISFFMSGIKSIADTQRKQVAVTLANGAMEKARTVTPNAVNTDGTSGLIKGRSQAAVTAAWQEVRAANADDVSDMNIMWDPEGGLSEASQWLPITTTSTVDKQTFTLKTIIGSCFRAKLATTQDSECTAMAPVQPLAENILMYRVRIIVTWSEGPDAPVQTYRLSSLIDPSVDVVWNTVLKPFAYDDEIIVSAGDARGYYAIASNDQVDYNQDGTLSPIVDLTQPGHSRVAVGSGDQIAGVLLTPPANTDKAGSETFKYAVRGTSMEKSLPATVTVRILPKPFEDSLKIEPGTAPVINDAILSNDFGTENLSSSRQISIALAATATVDLFSTGDVSAEVLAERLASERALAAMGVSIDGQGKVTYTAPDFGVVEPVVFYYYLVDESADGLGERYNSIAPARVVIDASEDEPIAIDLTIDIPIKTSGDLATNLDWQEKTGNPGRYTIRITDTNIGAGTQGRLSIDGANYNPDDHNEGKTVHYLQQGNSPQIAWFKYVVISPSGKESEEKTITLHVTPVAVDDSYTVRVGESKDLELVMNDGATDSTTRLVEVSELLSGTRGRLCVPFASDAIMAENGKVKFPAQTDAGVCTFTYKLESNSLGEKLTSPEAATVTVTVVQ